MTIDHKTLNRPDRLVLFHEFSQLRVTVYRQVVVEHPEFIDDVLRLGFLQVPNKLLARQSRAGLIED